MPHNSPTCSKETFHRFHELPSILRWFFNEYHLDFTTFLALCWILPMNTGRECWCVPWWPTNLIHWEWLVPDCRFQWYVLYTTKLQDSNWCPLEPSRTTKTRNIASTNIAEIRRTTKTRNIARTNIAENRRAPRTWCPYFTSLGDFKSQKSFKKQMSYTDIPHVSTDRKCIRVKR